MFVDQMHKGVDTQALLQETEAIDSDTICLRLSTDCLRRLLVVLHGLLPWGSFASRGYFTISEDVFVSQRCC